VLRVLKVLVRRGSKGSNGFFLAASRLGSRLVGLRGAKPPGRYASGSAAAGVAGEPSEP